MEISQIGDSRRDWGSDQKIKWSKRDFPLIVNKGGIMSKSQKKKMTAGLYKPSSKCPWSKMEQTVVWTLYLVIEVNETRFRGYIFNRRKK